MSKLTRRQRKLANQLEAALQRNSNGQATPRDIDMIARYNREARGLNGYTGEARSSSLVTVESFGGDHSSYQGYRGNPYTFHVSQTQDKHVFTCKEAKEVTDKCPIAKVPRILVPNLMWQAWLNLAEELSTEWIALLKGKLTQDDKGSPVYVIDSYYFPAQTVGGAHVDIPTGVAPKPGTIGAVHSHVKMNCFFSGTDLDHSNWPVEIVVNAKKEYKAVARHQLKCGEFAKNETEVYLTGEAVASKVMQAITEAISLGNRMEQAKRMPIVSSIPPAIPATAIVYTTDKSKLEKENPLCQCGHPYMWHYEGGINHWCRQTHCMCQGFTFPPANKDSKDSAKGEDTSIVTEADRQLALQMDNPPDKADPQDDIPDETVQSIVFPVGDGMTSEIDIESCTIEEMCPECEGEGWIVTEKGDGATSYTSICRVCNGDGLSELGRIRRSEIN